MSPRIRLEAGARQRASTDYDTQRAASSEAVGAHRGVDGGHLGGRRPPPLRVSVERGQGMLHRCAYGMLLLHDYWCLPGSCAHEPRDSEDHYWHQKEGPSTYSDL